MRVLWSAPWFRTLADVWAGPLREAGHEVLVVTTDRHFEAVQASGRELLVSGRARSLAGWLPWSQIRRDVSRFAPDVVVTDEVRDPRFALLAPRVPTVLLVHDARPHDAQHRLPWHHDQVAGLQHRRAARRVVFSHAVETGLTRPSHGAVRVVPLPSEMDDRLVPPLVPAEDRRDVVVAGRLGPYKNLPVVLAAWERHTCSPHYRGDRLLLLGDGEVGTSLPAHAEWRRGRFAFSDAAPLVARAKASIAFYRAGSQSGVAIWSMQVGTMPLVTAVGGLPEYLPAHERALHPDDVDGLARQLDVRADPRVAAEAGARAAQHYRERCSAQVSATALAGVLNELHDAALGR